MMGMRLPFIVRLACVLVSVLVVVLLLYFGRVFLSPVALSALFAVLLYPIVRFLKKNHVPEIVAIIIAIIILGVIFTGLVTFTVVQVERFGELWPQLETKLNTYVESAQAYARQHLGMQTGKQSNALGNEVGSILKSGASALEDAAMVFSNFAIQLFLMPIYIFLFLYYRKLWAEFFMRLTTRDDHPVVGKILRSSSNAIQRYLVGRTLETGIVAAANAGALLLLGIDGALLFGLLDGLLNLIPFVGVIIGSILPALMALLTKDSPWYAVAVIGAHLVIQFLDDHLLLPFLVGGKVNINSLAALVAIFAGGAIWGLLGMVLALPVVAILKIVFDQVEPLKPWALILGDKIPESSSRKG